MDSTEPDRRIVVGVDGSDASRGALRWAVRQAERTGAVVEAVIAWELPITGWSHGVMDGKFAERAEHILAESVEALAGPRGRAVRIHRRVVGGNAAQVLIDASQGASLLVVGSRGLGGFSGALLGSVSHHCSQQSHCPVVIVRRSPADESR